MREIDFNNKTFSLIENSKNGKVGTQTTFKFRQDGKLVTADYYGGTIVYGKIIALLGANALQMRYQCLTTDNELKTGKAVAQIGLNENKKIKLTLNWQWLEGNLEKGISEYLEQ